MNENIKRENMNENPLKGKIPEGWREFIVVFRALESSTLSEGKR